MERELRNLKTEGLLTKAFLDTQRANDSLILLMIVQNKIALLLQKIPSLTKEEKNYFLKEIAEPFLGVFRDSIREAEKTIEKILEEEEDSDIINRLSKYLKNIEEIIKYVVTHGKP